MSVPSIDSMSITLPWTKGGGCESSMCDLRAEDVYSYQTATSALYSTASDGNTDGTTSSMSDNTTLRGWNLQGTLVIHMHTHTHGGRNDENSQAA